MSHQDGHVCDSGLQHVLFQVANGLVVLACLVSNSKKNMFTLHSFLVVGFLIYAIWAWNVICSSIVFAYTVAYMFVNAIQSLYLGYSMREVTFPTKEIEDLYTCMFEPMKIERSLFKRLISSEFAQVIKLSEGEAYAMQNLTKTDHLSLLLSGRVNVISGSNYLHSISEKQFLDSPEYESQRVKVDGKFKVSIIAATSCTYISWSRQGLDYLLLKETFLSHVLSLILAKDVADKLYAMNEKIVTEKGSHLDIRLPTVTTSLCDSVSSFGSTDCLTGSRGTLNIRVKDRTVSSAELKKTARSKSLQIANSGQSGQQGKRLSHGSLFKHSTDLNGQLTMPSTGQD